jgi:NitT/TauT family transport system substrate-binding protein
MKAYLKAGDIVLLCGAATGGTELMVQASSPIKSVKDLKGKVVGVNQAGSTVETMVRYQVVQAGLKPEEDVRFIEVKPAEQAAALQSGDVAAVAAPAPWPSFVQINAKARPLLNWKQIYADGKYLSGSFYATKKWVEANPKLARQFVAATKKITDELNANRAKGDAQVLAAWEKVTRKTLKPEVARAAFKTIQYTTEASEAGLQKFADINFELGVLKGDKPQVQGFVWK